MESVLDRQKVVKFLRAREQTYLFDKLDSLTDADADAAALYGCLAEEVGFIASFIEGETIFDVDTPVDTPV